MRAARPRVIGRDRWRGRRHLTLVDNINLGEPIVATAKKRNEALLVAEELGIELETVDVEVPRRRTRKRVQNRNGPVQKTQFPWESVNPTARLHALMMAGGDIRRCKPINEDTVVILNHPAKDKPS